MYVRVCVVCFMIRVSGLLCVFVCVWFVDVVFDVLLCLSVLCVVVCDLCMCVLC